jgi:exosortase D (VPLPA-CTERM-specific)
MSQQVLTSPISVYREPNAAWVSFAVAAAMLVLAFRAAIVDLVRIWDTQAEYSFGYLIPFISLFLIWQRKDRLERVAFAGSWVGFGLVLLSLIVMVIGNISTLGTVSQYALLLAIVGLALSYTGAQAFRVILVPLVVLAFMVPLPNYLLRELSQLLQLVSSQIGVGVIRLFGISVYLEGNVIDLGAMKLQVVEACSGLRYLFPLMTLGFIAAYFYQEKFWKRAVVFLSTIPVTVLMNSFRIGLIGITVEYWGKSMAEGFLHDFEGWIIFMACTAVILVEMWLLSRGSTPPRHLQEVFGLDLPAPAPENARCTYRALPRSYLAAIAIVAVTAAVSALMPESAHLRPVRKEFSQFPLEMGSWKGRTDFIDPVYMPLLQLDDYILADFTDVAGQRINFYVPYYATQVNGNSVHSPRACIPGDGWEIIDFAPRVLRDVSFKGMPLKVNRVVIQKGEHKQLVYYWFQQRGRIVTDEYVVKLFIFWDSLMRHRSDGAMVRLVAPLGPGEEIEAVDQRLEAFATTAVPALTAYVPD